jgi:hypothetical protein
VGEFNAAAPGGDQTVDRYRVALRAEGDESIEIPFEVARSGYRQQIPLAVEQWPDQLDHVRNSIMLLVPIDAAVLMEAVLPRSWLRSVSCSPSTTSRTGGTNRRSSSWRH